MSAIGSTPGALAWLCKGTTKREQYRRRSLVTCIALAVLGSFETATMYGQSVDTKKAEFDVASLKPAPPGATRRRVPPQFQGGVEGVGGRVTMHNRTLADLIAAAYKAKLDLISGPGWIGEDLFDLDAKLPAGTTYAKAPEMLQVLLQNRFGLVIHRAERAVHGYNLVVAHGGPHLVPATPASKSPVGPVPPTGSSHGGPVVIPVQGGGLPLWWGKATMTKVAEFLSGRLSCPVVDLTGISGEYESRLPVYSI